MTDDDYQKCSLVWMKTWERRSSKELRTTRLASQLYKFSMETLTDGGCFWLFMFSIFPLLV